MKISKAKTEKKISQQKAKIKFTLLEMNLLFMISSDIKKRLVKILSADVFKVIIKPMSGKAYEKTIQAVQAGLTVGQYASMKAGIKRKTDAIRMKVLCHRLRGQRK